MERIDILMATYNGAKYVETQIQSILKQSYTNWTLYISDDGSSDETLSIVKQYVDGNKIILLDLKPHGNPRDNFLDMMRYSTAKLCMFCDQDDYWQEDKVLHAYQSIQDYVESPLPVVSYSDLVVVDQNLQVINDSFIAIQGIEAATRIQYFVTQNCNAGCTSIFNTAMKEAVLKIKNPENLQMHDWAMTLIGSSCGKVIYNPHADILYRQHVGNNVGAKNIYSLSYLNQKLHSLKLTKYNMKRTQVQVLEIYNTLIREGYDIYPTSKKVLEVYSSFPKMNKLARIYNIYKYKLNRSHFIRNCILLLYS